MKPGCGADGCAEPKPKSGAQRAFSEKWDRLRAAALIAVAEPDGFLEETRMCGAGLCARLRAFSMACCIQILCADGVLHGRLFASGRSTRGQYRAARHREYYAGRREDRRSDGQFNTASVLRVIRSAEEIYIFPHHRGRTHINAGMLKKCRKQMLVIVMFSCGPAHSGSRCSRCRTIISTVTPAQDASLRLAIASISVSELESWPGY